MAGSSWTMPRGSLVVASRLWEGFQDGSATEGRVFDVQQLVWFYRWRGSLVGTVPAGSQVVDVLYTTMDAVR